MTEVCRAFRNNGRCRYGDKCTYEHSEGDAIASPPREECFNFKTAGACAFGDKCRFTHGESDPRFDDEGKRVKSERPERVEREKTEKSSPREKKRRPRKPRTTDVASKPKSDEVCKNYALGKCRYGSDCPRQHVGDVEQMPVVKIDEVCQKFQTGACKFGDQCRRQHIIQE
jgi:hypothetical protein